MSRLAMPARPRTRGSRLTALSATAAVAFSLVTGVVFTRARHGAPALADASTGTGGVFVATQGRVLDTRSGSPMTAGAWLVVSVAGLAGVPTSGVSAVQVGVSALAPITTTGTISLSADLATPKGGTALDYGSVSGAVTNTAIVAVGSDGKIKVKASSAVNVAIDVQGFYTAGDTADGGYVSVTPTRTVDTRYGTGLTQATLGGGSTSTISVGGTAGVPASATAVFVNFAVLNRTVNGGYLTAYDSDLSRPNIGLDYPGSIVTSLGTTVPLGAAGTMKVYVAGSSAVDLTVDVIGYFSGTTTTGAFTPATARVASSITLAATSVTNVRVAGVAGVPLAGSGISAVAMNIQETQTGSAGGYLRVWNPDQAEPATASLNLDAAPSSVSNFVTMQVGAVGDINVRNSSTDALKLTIDVQGWYSNAGLAIPNGQRETQQSVTLQADATSGGGWVTYKYRVGTVAAFANVPVSNAADGGGSHPSAWPVGKSSGAFTAYTWNIRDTLAAISGNNGLAPDSLVQVEACYGIANNDPNPSCGMPANVQFAQSAFGAGLATTGVGPGSLAELTGDFQVSSTDASAASSLTSLGVGRSLTTLAPADAGVAAGSQRTGPGGVFGPGWTADLSSDAGDADLTVTDSSASGYLLFTGPGGGIDTYEATTPLSAYPISFIGISDAAGNGEVVAKASASQITMTDPDLSVTTWTKTGSTWAVSGVTQPGSNSATTYTYNGAGLVTRILAPVPSGVTCGLTGSPATADTTPGCRSLILTYQTLTVSGTTVTRLQKVTLSVPQASGSTSQVDVAAYDYTSTGLLADAYDPRISPALKAAYTYTAASRLATLTPPGQAAYSISYDSTGRLSSVSRPDPANGPATTTVVYGVPTTGSNAPIPMDASTTGTWDETTDLPVTGTAVFTPERNPAGTTPATVTSADWPYASIDYMDVNGHTVNSAQYGAGAWQIDATQYDANGADVWDLTAGNRAQARTTTADTDSYVAGKTSSAARADLLASTTVINPVDPNQTTDTFGPTHPITLAAGGTPIDGRTHVSTTYDEGAPNGNVNPATGSPYDLPTTELSAAFNVQTQNDTTFPDASITHTGYDSVVGTDPSGWTLGRATSSTVQMASSPSSADLTTYTRSDTNGRTIESRLPGDPNGTGPRTNGTTYYTATGSGSCVSAKSAGMVCSIAPAGQPSSGSPLPVETYTYNRYGQQLTETDTYGTGSSQVIRTLSNIYDDAGRHASHDTAVAPTSAGGTALPAVNYGYDATTGLPTTASTTVGGTTTTLTTSYDSLGRATAYTDANGTTATTSYDLDGRTAAVNDGKLTATYIYDSASEHRSLVTREDTGIAGAPSTFIATYDADANMASETYPSGLAAATDYDNGGNATALTYSQGGSTWMAFTAARDAQGRIAGQTSPQSSQKYSYDPGGRLATVQDTYGSTCTTRTYGVDTDSNRTSLKSYSSSTSTCTTNTTPTSSSGSYDQADRLTNAGYTYDTLGRTSSIPSTDAQGIGSNATTTGTLTVDYYSNDLVHGEIQGSTTQTFTVDPLQNRIAASTADLTTTNHYSDNTDSPSWSATGSAWVDNVLGPDNGLDAQVTQAGTVTLLLRDMKGDLVASVPDDPAATHTTSYGEFTEYGTPRNPSSQVQQYGWLGSEQRSNASVGGLMLMGIRLYNITTGRFLSVDQVGGGNANAYVYANDPVGNSDTSGKSSMQEFREQNQCNKNGCTTATFNCENYGEQRCWVRLGWYLYEPWKSNVFGISWTFSISVSGHTVKSNQSYGHPENGDWNWHTNWGLKIMDKAHPGRVLHDYGYYNVRGNVGHLNVGTGYVDITGNGVGSTLDGRTVYFTLIGDFSIT